MIELESTDKNTYRENEVIGALVERLWGDMVDWCNGPSDIELERAGTSGLLDNLRRLT